MIRTLAIFLSLAMFAIAGNAWRELPPLPDAHGFAGAYAGVSGGNLIVAGGANFPDGAPGDGGV